MLKHYLLWISSGIFDGFLSGKPITCQGIHTGQKTYHHRRGHLNNNRSRHQRGFAYIIQWKSTLKDGGMWSKYTISHYNDVIMGMIASQITSLTIVHSAVYSDADQRKHQSPASPAFVRRIHRGPTGEFPAQMASNAENDSIWWRHHGWSRTTSPPLKAVDMVSFGC